MTTRKEDQNDQGTGGAPRDARGTDSERSDERRDIGGAAEGAVHIRGASSASPHPNAKPGEKTLGDVMHEREEKDKARMHNKE